MCMSVCAYVCVWHECACGVGVGVHMCGVNAIALHEMQFTHHTSLIKTFNPILFIQPFHPIQL